MKQQQQKYVQYAGTFSALAVVVAVIIMLVAQRF
jgi:hypothetical protein